MSIDLKKILRDRIETVSPEYGLNEILYTSFTRSYGYRGIMSASDAVYAVTSLIETSPAASVALGYSVEWTSNGERDDTLDTNPDTETPQSWWHSSFFKACDALDGNNPEGDHLRQGVTLCMKIQKAIVRQAVAIIEKQVIITLSTCRVATLKDGPHLPIFWNPLTLNRLAQFLVYAIRVRRCSNEWQPLTLTWFESKIEMYSLYRNTEAPRLAIDLFLSFSPF